MIRPLSSALLFCAVLPNVATAQAEPPTARAFANAEWVTACRAALDRRVRRERPNVVEIRLDPASLEDWQITLRDTGVRGNGEAVAGGAAAPLTFRCTYSDRLRAVTRLDYRLGKTGA